MDMRRPVFLFLIIGALAGCSDFHREERPPWRAQAEAVCLSKGIVQESSFLRAFHEMDGPGICGLTHPFKVTALAQGRVVLNATQTLDCPMIAALDRWVREVVQPAATARFGEPVVRINSMGSYSCRGINNMSGANLSEHAFGNAIDIGGFVLASGRELNIMRGFNGADEQERAFLHEAHAGACSYFTTVLGPGYNIFHYNHFHVDLAMHGSTSRGPRRYCKPVPQTNLPEPPVKDNLPDPPRIEEEMDIARAPVPEPGYGAGAATLVASAPPSPAVSSYTPRPVRMDPPRPIAPLGIASSGGDARSPRGIKPAMAGAPLITFGDAGAVDADRPEPPRRSAALAPPPDRGTIRPPAAVERPYRSEVEDPEPVAAEEPEPANTFVQPPEPGRLPTPEGTAKDWDLTSSVRR